MSDHLRARSAILAVGTALLLLFLAWPSQAADEPTLAGALIGGMVVRVAQINFGWGPVQTPYEELLFSLLGAIALVAVGRFVRSGSKKKVTAR